MQTQEQCWPTQPPPAPPHVDSRRAPRRPSPAVSSFVRGLHPAAGSEFGGQRALSSCRPPKRDIQTRSSARADSLFRETSSSSPSFSTSENLTDCALYFSHLRTEMQKRTQRGPRPPGSPLKLLPREPPTLRPAVSWLRGPLRSWAQSPGSRLGAGELPSGPGPARHVGLSQGRVSHASSSPSVDRRTANAQRVALFPRRR